MLPSNIEGLKPVKINSLVYEKLNATYKVNDQRLRGLNTFIARGMGPLCSIWDNILKWEAALSTVVEAKVSGLLGSMHFKDLSLHFTEMRRQMDKALHLLGSAHALLLDRRRLQLKSFFDPKFHYLLKQSNPVTSELLGDNVNVKVGEAIKLSEAAQRIQFSPKYQRNWCGRGRFTPWGAHQRGFHCGNFRRDDRSVAPYNQPRGQGNRGRMNRFRGGRVNSRISPTGRYPRSR